MPLPGFQQGRHQRLVAYHPGVGQFGHQFVQLPAKLLAAGAAAAGGGGQSARRQHGQADARQQPPPHHAAQSRQQAVLRTLDVHRQQRGVGLVGGQGWAFVDFHQRPGNADPSLREHRNPLAGFQMLDQGFQIVRIGRIDADVAGHGDERPDPPVPGYMGVDDEDRHVRQERRQQRSVQIGQVIGDDQQPSSVARVMFPSAQFHPEQPPEQAAGQSL